MLKLVMFSLTYFSLFHVVVDRVVNVVINPGDIPTDYLVMVALVKLCVPKNVPWSLMLLQPA